MTLVISCGAKNSILQVSDRLLTMPNGTRVDVAATKAICLWCRDAHVALAYTGLAKISERRVRIAHAQTPVKGAQCALYRSVTRSPVHAVANGGGPTQQT